MSANHPVIPSPSSVCAAKITIYPLLIVPLRKKKCPHTYGVRILSPPPYPTHPCRPLACNARVFRTAAGRTRTSFLPGFCPCPLVLQPQNKVQNNAVNSIFVASINVCRINQEWRVNYCPSQRRSFMSRISPSIL